MAVAVVACSRSGVVSCGGLWLAMAAAVLAAVVAVAAKTLPF